MLWNYVLSSVTPAASCLVLKVLERSIFRRVDRAALSVSAPKYSYSKDSTLLKGRVLGSATTLLTGLKPPLKDLVQSQASPAFETEWLLTNAKAEPVDVMEMSFVNVRCHKGTHHC